MAADINLQYDTLTSVMFDGRSISAPLGIEVCSIFRCVMDLCNSEYCLRFRVNPCRVKLVRCAGSESNDGIMAVPSVLVP